MKHVRHRSVTTALALITLAAAGCDRESPGRGGSSSGAIPVGLVVAVTGSGSFYGQVMRNGAELAAELIRERGGVEGYTFDIVVEDHESGSADVAVAAGRKLIYLDRAPVILSSFTAPTAAIHSLATDEGVLMLNGGGVGSELIGRDGLYNTRSLGEQLVPHVVRWALDRYGVDRIATLYWNDAAGRAIHRTTVEVCEEMGCTVVADEAHDVGATNFGPQLARIRAASPEMLVLGSYGNDVGHIVAQARRQGLSIPIIGNEWTPDAHEIGGSAMDGYVAILDHFSPTETDDPEAIEFVRAYRTRHGTDPEFYAANYFELVELVLTDLVRRTVAGGSDPAEPGALHEAMADAVGEEHEFATLYGEAMIFNLDGTVVKPAGVFEVRDGVLVQVGMLEDGRVVDP